jgi:hypothetical protein
MMFIKDNRLRLDVVLHFMFYEGQLQTHVSFSWTIYISHEASSGDGEKVFSIFDRIESTV